MQARERGIASGSNQNRTCACIDQTDAAQDEGAHDDFADIGRSDHQGPQMGGIKGNGRAALGPGAGPGKCRSTRQLVDFARQLACSMRRDRRLAGKTFVAKHVHRSLQHQPGGRCVVSYLVDEVTTGEIFWLAAGKTLGRLDLMGVEHRKHLVQARAEICHLLPPAGNVVRRSPPIFRRSSVISRYRPALRCLIRQVHHGFVHITPAPAFRRVIALDDGVAGGVEMRGRVAAGGLIAAADMTTFAAEPQMKPYLASFETFLAAKRHGLDRSDRRQVRALIRHGSTPERVGNFSASVLLQDTV
ncbi:hypothetical protein AGR1B_Lc50102 [Agrobacterium fabacearum S56]|nr:hypothetical protein AGR1B_Lc50102 [Agrobacterium fabacearum S56]